MRAHLSNMCFPKKLKTPTKNAPRKYTHRFSNKLTFAGTMTTMFLLEMLSLFTKKQWHFFSRINFLRSSTPSPSPSIGFKLSQLHMVSFTCLARHTEAQSAVQGVKRLANANSSLMMKADFYNTVECSSSSITIIECVITLKF